MAASKKTPAKAPAKAGALDNQKIVNQIIAKSLSRVRQDVGTWNTALTTARKAERPKRYLLYNLYDEISIDGLLTSQLSNRILKSLSTNFTISDKSGKTNDEATALLQDKAWVNEINKAILGSITHGHSVIEFEWTAIANLPELKASLIDRQNIEPREGLFYPDYNADKFTLYREMAEYGTWILEFGDPKSLGLLNSAVPHVLFKRFAQSCWSELCEIAGIPPRVMKTDTQNASMLRRAERMMKDMGAAAWFIIDDNETFEWADSNNATGDVYQKLMTFCNNEISMLISGAVMGQDTVNGSNSKEQTMQDTLQTLVNSDLSLIEQEWNTKVIPALVNIGVLSGELVFSYPETEDISQLWTMVKDSMNSYEMDVEWMNTTFGLKIIKAKETASPDTTKLSLGGDFFV